MFTVTGRIGRVKALKEKKTKKVCEITKIPCHMMCVQKWYGKKSVYESFLDQIYQKHKQYLTRHVCDHVNLL